MTDKTLPPSATGGGFPSIYERATPRTIRLQAELLRKYPDPLDERNKLLYYMEAAETYGQECKRMEQELETVRDAHMANGLAADTLRTEIRELRDDMERGMANHNADLNASVLSEIAPSDSCRAALANIMARIDGDDFIPTEYKEDAKKALASLPSAKRLAQVGSFTMVGLDTIKFSREEDATAVMDAIREESERFK